MFDVVLSSVFEETIETDLKRVMKKLSKQSNTVFHHLATQFNT